MSEEQYTLTVPMLVVSLMLVWVIVRLVAVTVNLNRKDDENERNKK